jgi:hypothetical protein
MKLFKLLIILSLYSCGTDTSSSGNSPGNESKKEDKLSTSYYVDKEDDLVACDNTRKGNLAYVKQTSEFKACIEGGWTTVNVKGKDGVSGTNGTNGKDGTPVSSNQWYDAITGKMWIMTTIVTSLTGWSNSMSACTGNYQMPSPSEISLALIHGMKAAAQALVNAPIYIIANDGNPYTVNAGTLASSGQGAQFCIAK